MSIKDTLTLACPSCHKKSAFTVWKSINTAEDPSLKQAVRQKTAFLFQCPACWHKTVIDYGLLYRQPEEKLLIRYIEDDETTFEWMKELENGTSPLQPLIEEHYLLRLVRSQNRLIEKLLIFDEGLDDRIMEIYKVLILMDYTKKNPEAEDPALFFFKGEDGINRIHILVDHQDLCATQLRPELYDRLLEEYAPRLPDLREDGPLIDEQWAFRLLLNESNGET